MKNTKISQRRMKNRLVFQEQQPRVNLKIRNRVSRQKSKEQQGPVPSREESSQRTDTIANNASKAGENIPIGTKKRAGLPAWEPDVEDDLATLCTPADSVALAQEQSWQTMPRKVDAKPSDQKPT